MAGSIYSWGITAADNDDSDGDINWTEGQLPSTVNNSARQMMGRVAEYIADQGTQVVGGTSGNFTLTANSAFTAYADGLRLTIKAINTNTGITNLNVNSLGNKRIRKIVGATDVDLDDGDIQKNGVYELIYDEAANSLAGAWIIVNPHPIQLSEANTWSNTQTFENALVVNDSAASLLVSADNGDSRGDIRSGNQPRVIIRSFTAEGGATVGANFEVNGGSGVVNVAIGTLQEGGVEVAKVSTAGGAGTTDFPIGHTIPVFVETALSISRNGLIVPALSTANNRDYVNSAHSDAGTSLSGTWRSRGTIVDSVSPEFSVYLAERVS